MMRSHSLDTTTRGDISVLLVHLFGSVQVSMGRQQSGIIGRFTVVLPAANLRGHLSSAMTRLHMLRCVCCMTFCEGTWRASEERLGLV